MNSDLSEDQWLLVDPRIKIRIVHPYASIVWPTLDGPPVIEIGPTPEPKTDD